jgi:hypothetical protein
MSVTIDEVKANLQGLLHNTNPEDLTELELMLERSANTLLSKIDPVETIREVALSTTVHDDVYNYALPSDFKKIIDLIPQDNRNEWDRAYRTLAGRFDLQKAIKNRVISIEGNDGSKIIRINWKSRQGKLIHNMNSVTSNGTWSAVASATGISANSIFKKTGSASIEFNIVVTGDGIENTTMSAIDLTDEDEVGDFFIWAYFGTVPTSLSIRFGNDLTANYWTSTAQTTQADGTAFKVGWNLLKFSWSTASETGTVAPATIDAFRITVVSSAQNNVRIDNIMCSIGRNFDIKYYSKYLLKNATGTWINKTSNDTDVCVLDSDAIEIYNQENLIAGSQQSQNNSADIQQAEKKLNGNPSSPDREERMGLYAKYRGEHPSQSQKAVTSYGNLPFRHRL